jgi:hypothetical protein
MRFQRLHLALAGLAGALLLSGCIQVEQEYWINPDGSGTIRMDMAYSEALKEMGDPTASGLPTTTELEGDYSGNPFVTKMTLDEYTADGMYHTAVLIEVSSMTEFLRAAEADSGSAKEGLPSLELLENGQYRFSQLLTMDGDEELDEFSREMMTGAFSGMYWTVKLHAPNVVSTNGVMDAKTSTVEWRVPMSDLLTTSSGYEIEAVYQPPALRRSSLLWWIIGGGLCLSVCGVSVVGVSAGVFFLRRRKITAKPV